ncbi:MAG: KpsF/GutQ family sugar-phosphate isomerase [Candidatus Cloacimonadota bacterium]|nr:KpsF/GutQ family sugar-phosphate isomerase [Candidatus Cloacimonadota bacterium]
MDVKNNIIEILKKEARAILEISEKVDDNVNKAIELIMNCKGKIVITGIGKTGIIGRKISATLASTGTPSIYLHPAEGIHGDLGMVDCKDVVVMISNSGETQELIDIIPFFKKHQNGIICLTSNCKSTLAKLSDAIIYIGVPKDFEPLGLVPMASTTTALSMGNALATIVLRKKNFQKDDFALLHPGGIIGKRLLLKVNDIMHSKDENPVIDSHKKLKDAILVMTSKGLGCVSIIDDSGKLVGIITDGDLRRILQKYDNPLELEVNLLMTKNPKSITQNSLCINALNLMEEYAITMIPVVDNDNKPIAMIHMHDLIKAGLV